MSNKIKTSQARPPRRATLLIILDGFGLNPDPNHNAVVMANTPNFDRYFAKYPMTSLEASGYGVGLPQGQMGNSEVGHMTIGSGSIIKQNLVRIDDAVADGSFDKNPALVAAVMSAKATKRPLHLVGLVSDGGVHSHINHLLALIRLCGKHQVVPQLHMITDGRDTAQQAALDYLPELESVLAKCKGYIGSVMGRFYALDRDNRWNRVQKAFDVMLGRCEVQAESAKQAINQAYENGKNDEFIPPTGLPNLQAIEAGDEMVFFNFRNDRTREICAALMLTEFDDFDRGQNYQPINVTCMTHYDDRFKSAVAFEPINPEVTLGSVINDAGLKQLHCAETEKYPHVTFFFNGGRELPFEGETRVLIESPKVATYDLQPEMSAKPVADAVIDALQKKQQDFIVVNFANADMVGHTAIELAIIQAVEVLDDEVGRVLDCAVKSGYSIILTADHGNCDEMVDAKSGKPHTQHSQHPVPCLVIDSHVTRLAATGDLSAIAPTVLQLLGVQQPASMMGKSVIEDSW